MILFLFSKKGQWSKNIFEGAFLLLCTCTFIKNLSMIHDLCSNKCKVDKCFVKTQVNKNKNATSELISSHCENTFSN